MIPYSFNTIEYLPKIRSKTTKQTPIGYFFVWRLSSRIWSVDGKLENQHALHDCCLKNTKMIMNPSLFMILLHLFSPCHPHIWCRPPSILATFLYLEYWGTICCLYPFNVILSYPVECLFIIKYYVFFSDPKINIFLLCDVEIKHIDLNRKMIIKIWLKWKSNENINWSNCFSQSTYSLQRNFKQIYKALLAHKLVVNKRLFLFKSFIYLLNRVVWKNPVKRI